MNLLIEKCDDARNGHYVHALEVHNVDEFKSAIESIYEQDMDYLEELYPISFEGTFDDYEDHLKNIAVHGADPGYEEEIANEYAGEKFKWAREIVIDFFETMELYCLEDSNEQEVFDQYHSKGVAWLNGSEEEWEMGNEYDCENE